MADSALPSPSRARRKVTVLGNCVAHRLQSMLAVLPDFASGFELIPALMIHTLSRPEQWEQLSRTAQACDVVITQPLFRYGACNTAVLRDRLSPEKLIVMSTPNFEAYFPDVITLGGKTNLKTQPVLDWDSLLIFSCYVAGVSIFDVETVYRSHPMFQADSMRRAIASALENCLRRDQGVDIALSNVIAAQYAQTRLFHTWQHPSGPLLAFLLKKLAEMLGLKTDTDFLSIVDRDGFGFNQWPVLTAHGLFHFPAQTGFRIGGQVFSLEDIAMAYYNFYALHPHVVDCNRDKAIRL